MKSQYLKEFTKKDMPVDSLFAVKEKQSVRSYKNGYMFTLKVCDKTNEMMLNYFGGENESEVKDVHKTFESQDVVHIKGITSDFQGQINVAINPGPDVITKVEEYDISDFLVMTTKDIPKMISELKEIIAKVENKEIKRLLESIFNDDTFMKKYSNSAAASTNHHNFGGGLIEHVLNMIKISIRVVELHPELNKDLLIAGCIFHDIGKLSEIGGAISPEYTTEGILLGHISIGYAMVNEWISKLNDFPSILKQKILHMILSHHGEKEFGSPVEPLFPEATALHYIDNLDATVQQVIQKKEKANKEDRWIRSYSGFPTMYLE